MELTEKWHAARTWSGFPKTVQRTRPDEKVLETAFESLGRAAVQDLVSAPYPFGLAPQDRLAAMVWLSRQTYARKRSQDLTIILALVALGLAAAMAVLSVYPAWPNHLPVTGISDAVRKPGAAG